MIRVEKAGRRVVFIEDSSLKEWKMPLDPCVEGGATHHLWVQLDYVCFEIVGWERDQEHEKWQWEEETGHGFGSHWWVNCKLFVGIVLWVFLDGLGVFEGVIQDFEAFARRRWNSWCLRALHHGYPFGGLKEESLLRSWDCVCFHEIFYLDLLLLSVCYLGRLFLDSDPMNLCLLNRFWQTSMSCSKCSCQYIYIHTLPWLHFTPEACLCTNPDPLRCGFYNSTTSPTL